MKKIKSDAVDAGELRRRAEERFGARRADAGAGDTNIAPETQRLLHELQVHQIELEMQNEELQRARSEVEEGLARYTDLYEFAPVGYLTLNREGEIRQVNLTGARLSGLERSRLVGKRLAILVDADSRPVFNAFFTKVFETGVKETCEVVVRPELASPFAVEFAATSAAGGKECRVVATDITARKRAEALMAIRLRLQEFASSHSPKELLQKTLDEVEARHRQPGGVLPLPRGGSTDAIAAGLVHPHGQRARCRAGETPALRRRPGWHLGGLRAQARSHHPQRHDSRRTGKGRPTATHR